MNRSLMVINLSVGTVNSFSKSAICSKRSFGTRAMDPFREGGFLYMSIISRRSHTGRGAIFFALVSRLDGSEVDFLKYPIPLIPLNELPITSRENRSESVTHRETIFQMKEYNHYTKSLKILDTNFKLRSLPPFFPQNTFNPFPKITDNTHHGSRMIR